MNPVRLAHISDIHLTAKRLGWRRADLLSKKATGWMNVTLLGRGRRFRHAPTVTAILREELATRGYDHVVFSGDATGLAFDSEFRVAAEAMGVNDPRLTHAIAVPGNHDVYTKTAERQQLFEKHFHPWQHGTRIGEHVYPFAQQVGHVWLIGVNSSVANRTTWDASGRIGPEQLDRLRQLCANLSPGPRILVTHYPLRTAKGNVERGTHRLRDHVAALECAKDCGINLWLHGHIHKPFVLETSLEIPFPVICAGSATQTHRWAYNEYEVSTAGFTMLRRVFDPLKQAYADTARFHLEFKVKL